MKFTSIFFLASASILEIISKIRINNREKMKFLQYFSNHINLSIFEAYLKDWVKYDEKIQLI